MSVLVQMSNGEEFKLQSDHTTSVLAIQLLSHAGAREIPLEDGGHVYINTAQIVTIREATD